MKHIAITGVSYAGKTRLFRHLPGYLYCAFSDRLKTLASNVLTDLALTEDIPAEYAATPTKISLEKEHYRSFLIGLGSAIGYSRDPSYIEKALERWHELDHPPAYFDNVRSREQADYLRSLGWQIVELAVPFEIRRQRASYTGRVLTQEMADADMKLPDDYIRDLTLDGTAPPSVIARQLLCYE